MQSKQFSQVLVIALLASAGFSSGLAHALSPTPNPTVQPSYPSWDNAAVYNGGQRVTYNGAVYEARWWTQGNNPAESGEWGPWKLVSGVQITPTPSPSPTPSTLVTESLTTTRPTMGGTCSKPSPSNWQVGQQINAGEVVSVGGGLSSNGGMIVFKAIVAHLSSALNKPQVNSTSVTYDSAIWQSGTWNIPPCPPPTPTPSAPPVNQAPSISFSTAQSVSCQTPFWLNANASDSDGSVAKVEFYIDNNLVGSKTSAPYELTVNNSNGCSSIGSKKTMYAIATDNLGLQTRSATVTVTIISDVLPTPSPTPGLSYAAWNATVAYTTGQRVSYNGRAFEAKWWTQGQTPNAADQWGPWKDLGLIANATPSPTPTITSSPSPTPSTTPSGPAVVSSVQVTTWKNGAKGAYSLVHDDYCSMYYANDPYIKIIDPELSKRGLVASFGMITSNCSDQHWAAAKEFMSRGHEIVNHSRSHPNPYIPDASLEAEITGATADMAAKLDGYKPSYFIWPGDVASTKAIDFIKAQPNFIGGRATHLVDGSGPNNAVDYTTMPAGVNPANFDNPYRVKWDLFTADGKWSLYPMGSEILNLHIDAAISQGGWATRTSHSVDTGYYEVIPLDRYIKHLDYAKAKVDSGELWMDTPSNVIKYRYAREHCRVIAPASTQFAAIAFDTSSAECKKYATPITLQVKAIYQGGGLSALQNGKALPVRKAENETYYVTADPLAGSVSFAYYLP
ncbi:carbohydrate-binding protein [Chitinibacter sp. SCUT-21]|uniref:carbohydrate-binding protein n=1 Tax=Chitinibacter sp. SCUT-21 TaxID=2970891 RepID=UPI0035A6AD2A